MSQFDYGTINPASKNGTELGSDLNNFRNALNSMHSGTTRPPYAQRGTLWYNTSTLRLSFYDGAQDISLMTIDETNNSISSFTSNNLIANDVIFSNNSIFSNGIIGAVGSISAGSLTVTGTASFGSITTPGGITAGSVNTTGGGSITASGGVNGATLGVTGTGVFGGVLTANNRMNVNSGGLIVNGASGVSATNITPFYMNRLGSTGRFCEFYFDGANANGNIALNGSGTQVQFNTGSDYRLKQDIVNIVDFTLSAGQFMILTNPLLKIMGMQPVTYKFKSDPVGPTYNGFIAHELQKVAPNAVSGVHNETQDLGTASKTIPEIVEDDVVISPESVETKQGITQSRSIADGFTSWEFTETVPVMQGVDHSLLVPELVASVQQLTLMVLELKEQVEVLQP